MTLPKYLPPQPYNSVLDTDSYKLGHFRGYRVGTTNVYSYIESRGGRYPATVWAGLQPLLYAKLGQPVQDWEIEEAASFAPKHGLPFNKAMWDKIVNKYDRKLPLRIRAVPEGLLVSVKNALLTTENLDPDCASLTSYKETMLLRDLWTASTIATRIFYMKRGLKAFFDAYSDNPVSPFALLDFSSRGCMGLDHNLLGGVSHLFSFMGSDSVPAIRHANYYYFSDMSAYSVNASEHSIACSFGQNQDAAYIRQSIERMVPEGGILSLVGDTWNIFEFAKTLVAHKELIANKNVHIVCRPDSGDIKVVLPEVFQTLADGFGTTSNSHGLGVLNLNAKVLQGDGIDENTYLDPFDIGRCAGIAPDSIMDGSGGGLMTKDLDRDTNQWAMKASDMVIDGEEIEIRKNPITDPGKQSKAGRFALVRGADGRPLTVSDPHPEDIEDDLMQDRFVMGDVVNPTTLADVRKLIDSQL